MKVRQGGRQKINRTGDTKKQRGEKEREWKRETENETWERKGDIDFERESRGSKRETENKRERNRKGDTETKNDRETQIMK